MVKHDESIGKKMAIITNDHNNKSHEDLKRNKMLPNCIQIVGLKKTTGLWI
jgi:hypothetical protein